MTPAEFLAIVTKRRSRDVTSSRIDMGDVNAATRPSQSNCVAPSLVARHGARALAPLALLLASGFAGLGYQIVWAQQAALWLGHESAAVLAVVAAFFGGLSVGSWTLGARIEHSTAPARWYVACELAIAVWSVALAFLFKPITRLLLELIGAQPAPIWHWAVAFCGTFFLLLPATVAMGATLPAMERVLVRIRDSGTRIAWLYAANTFGAVLGVLASAFWLIPQWGLKATTSACAVLNLACAAIAAKAFPESNNHARVTASSHSYRSLWLLTTTGFLGIAYEVLVVRVLSQVTENTVYTFAILLAVYLIGTAFGAAVYGRWLANALDVHAQRDRLLRYLGIACVLGTLSLAGAASVKTFVLDALAPSMAAALVAEAATSIIAFLPPSLLMGALFSHLCATASDAGIGFGRALGFNTLGAAVAPVVAGVLLLPAVGARLSLALVALAYLALSSRNAWFTPAHWATLTTVTVLAVLAPQLAIVDVPEGGRVVLIAEGAMATVAVVEDADGIATLHINNRQQEGSSATRLADGRQALLPMLLHSAPRRALFLGLGTGATARSASTDPTVQVDAVELLPEVIVASAYFTGAPDDAGSSRLHVMAADARRFVRANETQYDVIVSDNFHPARSGAGSLYTVEHFAAVREALAANGVFCQWLPLHQLDLDTLRSIVRSFVAVYPNAWAMLATNSLDTPVVGLVARPGADPFDVAEVRARLAAAAVSLTPTDFGVPDELALLGSFVAGPRALAQFARDAPLNTDDHPVVVYRAPRIAYVHDSLPRDRLLALLHEVDIHPEELLAPGHDVDVTRRLAAYWSARNQFIAAGHDVEPTADVRRMLAQVRDPLLSVLRISPEFRPAYDPLLRMATVLGDVDAAAARSLLTELNNAQPSRPEAAQALRELANQSL